MPHRRFALLAAVALAIAATACTPLVETRGNLLSESKIGDVKPGVSSRADVEQAWGPPTTIAPFDNKTWFYIGETTSQKGIFEPEVTKRQMIRVTFADDDLVDKVSAVDPKNGRDIAFVDRKTSTAGKEFTAFQQFVGNLGKFNANDVEDNRKK